jgi:hypothetical protein
MRTYCEGNAHRKELKSGNCLLISSSSSSFNHITKLNDILLYYLLADMQEKNRFIPAQLVLLALRSFSEVGSVVLNLFSRCRHLSTVDLSKADGNAV